MKVSLDAGWGISQHQEAKLTTEDMLCNLACRGPALEGTIAKCQRTDEL